MTHLCALKRDERTWQRVARWRQTSWASATCMLTTTTQRLWVEHVVVVRTACHSDCQLADRYRYRYRYSVTWDDCRRHRPSCCSCSVMMMTMMMMMMMNVTLEIETKTRACTELPMLRRQYNNILLLLNLLYFFRRSIITLSSFLPRDA